ncbi:fused MFS/spermidine synthase [Paenarthrobacter sp. PH39-S1]|uniref:spermidine synthase n=1 Tax=Paenarthrobacter sp. PH39-S1 TaxID=3046204 RepID=UPI0024BABAD1|nr:fused MFS/spermidine synthase [Paenarthrobacter sp. PH39-S1]MDJ0357553.1 fused MFS/spermidine synthase [Paenarthrobacter sp. PH39-S1]
MADKTRYLRTTGQHATISPDGFKDGSFVLSIGGAEQSHVNLAHPEEIFYEYLRRIGHIVDLAAPAGEPIRVLHLGAGALTLARYIQVTRPGSVQHAVELERELLDYVLQQLPLPAGTALTTHIGDAREVQAALPGDLFFDVIILDIFSGPDAPEHIACTEFYEEAAARLSPGGVLIVNVGDEPALTLVRSQVSALRRAMTGSGPEVTTDATAEAAVDPGGSFRTGDVAAFAETGMFAGRYPGNIILIGTTVPWPEDWTAELTAGGPHPATVLTGVELDRIAG